MGGREASSLICGAGEWSGTTSLESRGLHASPQGFSHNAPVPTLSTPEIVFFFLSCGLFMGWQAWFFLRAVIDNDRAGSAEADARRAAWEASLEE